MPGWFKLASERASRSKRERRSASSKRVSGSTFSATILSTRVSRARNTSPMPPAPSRATISYGPSFVPGDMLTSSPDSGALLHGGPARVPSKRLELGSSPAERVPDEGPRLEDTVHPLERAVELPDVRVCDRDELHRVVVFPAVGFE